MFKSLMDKKIPEAELLDLHTSVPVRRSDGWIGTMRTNVTTYRAPPQPTKAEAYGPV